MSFNPEEFDADTLCRRLRHIRCRHLTGVSHFLFDSSSIVKWLNGSMESAITVIALLSCITSRTPSTQSLNLYLPLNPMQASYIWWILCPLEDLPLKSPTTELRSVFDVNHLVDFTRGDRTHSSLRQTGFRIGIHIPGDAYYGTQGIDNDPDDHCENY